MSSVCPSSNKCSSFCSRASSNGSSVQKLPTLSYSFYKNRPFHRIFQFILSILSLLFYLIFHRNPRNFRHLLPLVQPTSKLLIFNTIKVAGVASPRYTPATLSRPETFCIAMREYKFQKVPLAGTKSSSQWDKKFQ